MRWLLEFASDFFDCKRGNILTLRKLYERLLGVATTKASRQAYILEIKAAQSSRSRPSGRDADVCLHERTY